MKKYRVGMMGFGFMGEAHTYAYKAIPFFYGRLPIDAELSAVCCRHLETARGAAGEYGYAFATDSSEAFFERELDIIHICSPNALHKPVLDEAVRRGIHIYCEKPVAGTYAEAAEVAGSLAGKNIVTKVGFHSRCYPNALRAKEILGSGILGKPLGFNLRYFTMNRLAGAASPNAVKSGAILDLGSHILDMGFHLLGEYEALTARSSYAVTAKGPDSAEDAFHAVAVMKNGATGILEASKIVQGANNDYTVEVNCEKGSLRFTLEESDWLYVYDTGDKGGDFGGNRGYKKIECLNRYPQRSFPSPRHSPGWLGGHLHSIYEFLCGVRDNRPVQPDLKDGAYIQLGMELITRSAESGQWLEYRP